MKWHDLFLFQPRVFKFIFNRLSTSRGNLRKTYAMIFTIIIFLIWLIFEFLVLSYICSLFELPVATDIIREANIKYRWGFSDFDPAIKLDSFYEPGQEIISNVNIKSKIETSVNVDIFFRSKGSEYVPRIMYIPRMDLEKGNNNLEFKISSVNEEKRFEICILVRDIFNKFNSKLACGPILDTCISCRSLK